MTRTKPHWLLPIALGLFTPLATARAGELNLGGINRYASSEQVTSIGQLSDVQPTDWAYQALSNLVERYGCVAGYPNGSFQGRKAMTRFEAAALLNACLDRVTEGTDQLKKLMKEFEKELAILKGRVDGLGAKVGVLEAQQFSTTTKLSGQATMVLGGTSFNGSAINRSANSVNTASQGDFALLNATTFNYDLQLSLDTSFNGKDLLRTVLRSGNFDGTTNSFGGGGATNLGQLEVAFQEENGANIVSIDKLYYQVPFGKGFTASVGARVGQEDMLALWPSVYPSATVLDVLTLNGAPIAYNKNLGPGVGLWWQNNGWSISGSYVAGNGAAGSPSSGGIGTANAASSGTIQVGYQQEQWGAAFLYSAVQNNGAAYGTTYLMAALNGQPNLTNAFALSGYWQPTNAGWFPSISAGWGINSTTYNQPQPAGTPTTSQSWSVGLNWADAFIKGNAAGLALGQAPFVTAQSEGGSPNDPNWMWEWWYKFQVTDNISITPALFYLSRPLGQETPGGQSFNQLGALLKTQFSF